MQLNDIDAIEQIGAESPGRNFLLQILIGCADQPRVDGLLGFPANARKTSILQKVQKLALQADIQV